MLDYEKTLPCPKCGNAPTLEVVGHDGRFVCRFCQYEGMQGNGGYYATVAAWNKSVRLEMEGKCREEN